jgi:superfamily II DNA/RNA helicase
VVVSAEEKPLALLVLLQQLAGLLTIVFTGSVRLDLDSRGCRTLLTRPAQVEATHRLFLMLDAFEGDAPLRCVEYSSTQSQADRSRALESFRSRAVTVLIASDAATRGLDVEVRGCVAALRTNARR